MCDKAFQTRGKIISASESYIQRDLSHRVIRFPQKPFRFLQPDSLHILHKGHMEIIFKKTAKVAFAHGQIRRKGIQHNTLGMVFFHKTYDFSYHLTFSRICFYRLDFPLLQHENIINHLKKVCTDKDFITLFLFIKYKKCFIEHLKQCFLYGIFFTQKYEMSLFL